MAGFQPPRGPRVQPVPIHRYLTTDKGTLDPLPAASPSTAVGRLLCISQHSFSDGPLLKPIKTTSKSVGPESSYSRIWLISIARMKRSSFFIKLLPQHDRSCANGIGMSGLSLSFCRTIPVYKVLPPPSRKSNDGRPQYQWRGDYKYTFTTC